VYCWDCYSTLTNCIIWGNDLDNLSYYCWDPIHCLIGVDPLFLKNGIFDLTRSRTVEIGGNEVSLPDFIVEAPDYRLQAGSPCIDAGTAVGAPATDIDGTPRPQGAGIDMGAYEYTAPGGRVRPGDGNQDGALDLSDAIWLLGHLFLGTAPKLPCEGGTASKPGPGELLLLDVNGDEAIDLSDPIRVLSFLFLGGPAPPLGKECVRIVGCPETCGS